MGVSTLRDGPWPTDEITTKSSLIMTIVKKKDSETLEIYRVIKHGFNNPSYKLL
jgi:hypothetical protein